MHEKYTTSAFIFSSRQTGEADKVLTLLARDFGLINGLLKSVRNSTSKFKGFTEVGLLVSVTLVRGKNIWRITDVTVPKTYRLDRHNLSPFLKLILLTKKLVQGEERNEALFDVFMDIFSFLSKRLHSEGLLQSLELLGAGRIIRSLGYGRELPLNINVTGAIHESDLLKVLENKKEITSAINDSLKESQLVK